MLGTIIGSPYDFHNYRSGLPTMEVAKVFQPGL
jgi:hypothetical protein